MTIDYLLFFLDMARRNVNESDSGIESAIKEMIDYIL